MKITARDDLTVRILDTVVESARVAHVRNALGLVTQEEIRAVLSVANHGGKIASSYPEGLGMLGHVVSQVEFLVSVSDDYRCALGCLSDDREGPHPSKIGRSDPDSRD